MVSIASDPTVFPGELGEVGSIVGLMAEGSGSSPCYSLIYNLKTGSSFRLRRLLFTFVQAIWNIWTLFIMSSMRCSLSTYSSAPVCMVVFDCYSLKLASITYGEF